MKSNSVKEYNEDYYFVLANYFRSSHPQLPANMCISAKCSNRKASIEVQNNTESRFQPEDMFSIKLHDLSITGDPGKLTQEDVAYFKRFIIKNKKVLLKYWELKIDAAELGQSIDFEC